MSRDSRETLGFSVVAGSQFSGLKRKRSWAPVGSYGDRDERRVWRGSHLMRRRGPPHTAILGRDSRKRPDRGAHRTDRVMAPAANGRRRWSSPRRQRSREARTVAGATGTRSSSSCRRNRMFETAWPRRNAGSNGLCPMVAFAYAGVMYATASVGGKVVRFKLSPALARAHRQNRGKAMTEAEAVAFVETKRRARALRRARPYVASRA